MKLNRILKFTDIHWGARDNDLVHLNDCTKFIEWVVQLATTKQIDAIAFLGDWFENRSSIDLRTLQRSYEGMKKLDSIGIPIFFMIGNHDLMFKFRREIASPVIFDEFKNIILIKDEPISITTDTGVKMLFCPFLFHDEYVESAPLVNSHDVVFGHFEFQGFVVTGKHAIMEHGPDHKLFNAPKRIFSGHFHKRQTKGNVTFIGNTFCTNYGDVHDVERGVSIYELNSDRLTFENYPYNPMFFYVNLSELLDNEQLTFPADSRVKCFIDVPVEYSEIQNLKSEMMDMFNLREFTLEDVYSSKEMLTQEQDGVSLVTTTDVPVEYDQAIPHILETNLVVVNSSIRKDVLVDLFEQLRQMRNTK